MRDRHFHIRRGRGGKGRRHAVSCAVFDDIHFLYCRNWYLPPNLRLIVDSSLYTCIDIPAQLGDVQCCGKNPRPFDIRSHKTLFIVLSSGTRISLNDRITDTCYPFPSKEDCSANPNLCYTWKSTTFLLYLAAVIEGMTLVAYIAVFNGGYARRLNGWKVLSLLHTLIGIPNPLLSSSRLRLHIIFEQEC